MEVSYLTGIRSSFLLHLTSAVVVFMLFAYVFETYLDIRQYYMDHSQNLPKNLEGVIDKDTFLRSQVCPFSLFSPPSPYALSLLSIS